MNAQHHAPHELHQPRQSQIVLYPHHQLQLQQQQQLQRQLQQQQRSTPQQKLPPKRPRLRLLRALLGGLFQALVTALALVGLLSLAAAGFVLSTDVVTLPTLRPAQRQLVRAAETLGLPKPVTEAAEPRRQVIYLNREGGVILPGTDDARRNASSVVEGAGLERFEVPSFSSTPARWDAIMSCVQDQFSDYDVEVVDQRPVEGPYIMAMLGGRPQDLAARTGHEHSNRVRVTGLAPLGRHPIDDAVVFVFTQEMSNQTRAVCETTAHEVAHALGLDHVLNASDPVSHLRPQGRRSFQDATSSCGESQSAPRACANGSPTQNSHQQLLEVLGPAPTASRSEPPS